MTPFVGDWERSEGGGGGGKGEGGGGRGEGDGGRGGLGALEEPGARAGFGISCCTFGPGLGGCISIRRVSLIKCVCTLKLKSFFLKSVEFI